MTEKNSVDLHVGSAENLYTIDILDSLAQKQLSLIKVSKDQVLGRRIFNDNNYYITDKEGKVFPLPRAFEENRPNGISVDMLWKKDAKQDQKDRSLQESSKIVELENHNIVGWCTSTAEEIIDKSIVIKFIIITEKPTNKKHADLFPFKNYESEAGSIMRKRNSQVVARLLCQQFIESKCDFFTNPKKQI